MAQYHTTARFLKPEVIAQDFTPEQLTTILKMMRGCVMLRVGSYIESFIECMIPEGMELKHGRVRISKRGKKYQFGYIVKEGDPVPEIDTQEEQEEEEEDN